MAEPPEKLLTGVDGQKAAEKIILRWDSSSSDEARDRMLFEGDRQEADRYLSAVDLICNSMQNASMSDSRDPVRLAMARLEDEFRNILIGHSSPPEPDILYVSSYSFSEDDDQDGESEEQEEATPTPRAAETPKSVKGSGLTKMGSSDSMREMDLIPAEAIEDLRKIAARMVAAGYTRECIQAYSSIRKPILDSTFGRLGIERLSIGDVQRLDWPTVESLINRWIRASRVCIRVLFASERRLCDQIFPPDGGAGDACFAEAARSAAGRLFGFADAISISRRSPEKLFKILDLHDAVSDLLPDVENVFHSKPTESIRVQAAEIQTRLGEAARGMLTEFENAIQRETSKVPVPGGTIHPLTRYVMNYISLICDYTQTLTKLINQRPKIDPNSDADPLNRQFQLNADGPAGGEGEEASPLSSHLLFIATILQANLENKSKLYKDPALAHLFLMNNLHYIVQKAKSSPELRQMIGDAWLRRHTGRVRQHATGYQRATWLTILGWLRDEGIHTGGGFSSGVSKSALKERFKGFNAAFEDAHRTQAAWQVPDAQLREELRISVAEKLLPAYRAFLGRFRHHLEGGRHSDGYIKYSVDDLEIALGDFFEGSPGSGHHSRRKSQG
ncbi:exocyst complex component EXO70A1-like [Nymphaea colorata]|nr:exocyst complex component EXO70A1-like [Nymphaea colorata]